MNTTVSNAMSNVTTHQNDLGQIIGFPMPDWKPPAMPSADSIDGRFCRLERLVPAHAASLYAANSADAAGAMWTYLPYGPFNSPELYSTWVEEMSRRSDPWLYAIIDKATGRATGIAGYLRIDAANGSIEVGHVACSPLLQRTPAATEAMYLLMAGAFDLGYRRYEWKCDALNAASRAAARRLGFSFEGIFRQVVVVKGRNRDTAWHSIIDREWPAQRAAFLRWLDPRNFDQEGKQRMRLSALNTSTRDL